MKMIKSCLLTLLFLSCAHGQMNEKSILRDGRTGEQKTIDQLIHSLPDQPSVFVLGEIHDQPCHHQNQINIINRLSQKGRVVHVGLEVLAFPHQNFVDQYLLGALSDDEFQKAVAWGKDFSFYKPKILSPLITGGQALAINTPRELSMKVARFGLSSLTTEELALVPDGFELGNEAYFERFRQVMGDSSRGHQLPPEALARYFASQSLWDDTMATQVLKWREFYPDDHIVIIVGDFHVSFGGGLPDRLNKRGLSSIVTLSQVLTGTEVRYVAESPRADYVWSCGADN